MPIVKKLAQNKFNFVSLLLFAAILSACDSNISTPSEALRGKWVEVESTTDTLSFELAGDTEVMVLARGVISNGGVMRPKLDSGPYDYELLDDNKISLHWYLSASSIDKTYYFKHSGENLTIEQFYENPVAGTILTFRKIED